MTTHREKKLRKASQYVKTFVSDEWTLEYDLAFGPKDATGNFRSGIAEDVYIAACLAKKDDAINAKQIDANAVVTTAIAKFTALKVAAVANNGCTREEVVASQIIAEFAREGVSGAMAAQYLAERLHSNV